MVSFLFYSVTPQLVFFYSKPSASQPPTTPTNALTQHDYCPGIFVDGFVKLPLLAALILFFVGFYCVVPTRLLIVFSGTLITTEEVEKMNKQEGDDEEAVAL